MAHCTRVLLGVFAALGAALVWVAVVFGGLIFSSHAFGLSDMSSGNRTALTIGILGVTVAGSVAAAGVCFCFVAGDAGASARTDPSEGP